MATEVGRKITLFPNLKAWQGDYKSLRCPDCSVLMEPFSCEKEIIQKCSQCEGIWFDHHQLGVFKESLMRLNLSKIRVIAGPEYERLEGLSKCPRCHQSLVQFHYSYNSKVLLERCNHCEGIWSPLKQTLAFIDLARISQEIEPDIKALGKEMAEMEKDASAWRDLARAGGDLNRPLSSGGSTRGVAIFFPVRADGPKGGTPWLTLALLIACFAAFYFDSAVSAWDANLYAAAGQPSFLHLLTNMLFIWVFGVPSERGLGRFAFLMIYCVTAVVSRAEGAACAVLGAYLAMSPAGTIHTIISARTARVPSWMFCLGWCLLTLLWCASGIYHGYDMLYWKNEVLGLTLGFVMGALSKWCNMNGTPKNVMGDIK